MAYKRMTPAQRQAEARRVANIALGRKTIRRGMTIERARVVDEEMVEVTFAGTGMAPFRSAIYSPKTVLQMIGEA